MTRYINFATALILWEVGYKINTPSVYNTNDARVERISWSSCTITDFNGKFISRPKIYDVLGWLVFQGIHISVIPPTNPSEKYTAIIRKMYDTEIIDDIVGEDYYDVISKAISLSLKLI
jgi:hypothetical protein